MVCGGMRVVVGRRRAPGEEGGGVFVRSWPVSRLRDQSWTQRCMGAGAELELGLRWWSRRRDGWRLGRPAHALQLSTDGGGLAGGGDHSHASAAAIAGADVDGKNPREEGSPRESWQWSFGMMACMYSPLFHHSAEFRMEQISAFGISFGTNRYAGAFAKRYTKPAFTGTCRLPSSCFTTTWDGS